MGAGYSLKRLDAVEAKVQRCAYIQERFPVLSPLVIKDLWFTCIYQGQLALRELPLTESRSTMLYLEKTLANIPLRSRAGGLKEIVWLTMANINFLKTCKIRNALGIGL